MRRRGPRTWAATRRVASWRDRQARPPGRGAQPARDLPIEWPGPHRCSRHELLAIGAPRRTHGAIAMPYAFHNVASRSPITRSSSTSVSRRRTPRGLARGRSEAAAPRSTTSRRARTSTRCWPARPATVSHRPEEQQQADRDASRRRSRRARHRAAVEPLRPQQIGLQHERERARRREARGQPHHRVAAPDLVDDQRCLARPQLRTRAPGSETAASGASRCRPARCTITMPTVSHNASCRKCTSVSGPAVV